MLRYGSKWGELPLSYLAIGVEKGEKCENCAREFERDGKMAIGRTGSGRIVACDNCVFNPDK